MSDHDSAVGIFRSHLLAEDAVQELKRRGVDIAKLSIVGRDHHMSRKPSGFFNKDESMMFLSKQGRCWGGLWGLLFNAEFIRVPGLGPLLVAGPLVTRIAAALKNAAVVGGLSVVGAALCGMGIPRANVPRYENAIKSGKCVLIFQGPTEEAQKTGAVLSRGKALETALHVAAPIADA